ncbi:Mg2+ transporter [Haladaptatus paucihalophilus DX253]|uniref:Mg2+ transporter n=1 Tax=Haladaptatus paucihalophilus DX253 TaxID=797209 RepID=E7QN17_HALPU|nr:MULTISPECIES: magnesium transporter [Haladaptatus]EFW93812.1 Mg2+ transporter [Haladaptatus paucihalophilus DX253]GKZ15139.1 membrane protein [Haladaptatus sp. T7]SHL51895.1 mgtE-like transporter [Haladaptatus paucihalophilus DX253]
MTVREVAAEAYREALPALAASMVGGLFAGVVLSGMRAELRQVAGLLVLVPALLATRGNVYGSLGARLASGLHQGLVEPSFVPDDDRVWAAIVASLANGILASLFASVVAFVVLKALSDSVAPLPTLLAIALIAGLLSGVALTVAVVLVVFAGYRRGKNPDTLVGPLVTTTGDVFGISFLLLAVRIVIALGGG